MHEYRPENVRITVNFIEFGLSSEFRTVDERRVEDIQCGGSLRSSAVALAAALAP
jgi:hypothetical protein